MSHYGHSTNRWTGGSGGNRGFSSNYDQAYIGGSSNRGFGGNYDQGYIGGSSSRGFGGNYDRGYSGGSSNRGFGGNYDRDYSGGSSNRGFGGNYDQGYSGSSNRGFNRDYNEDCGRGFRSNNNEGSSDGNDVNFGGNNLTYGGNDEQKRNFGGNYASSFKGGYGHRSWGDGRTNYTNQGRNCDSEGYNNSDRDGSSFNGNSWRRDNHIDDGSDDKIKVEESESSNKSFQECLEEGSVVEIKNEKGGRPKYQCLHCKITFFNEDHIRKGGHRGHVKHCVDVKACFEATVGKKGLGFDFKNQESLIKQEKIKTEDSNSLVKGFKECLEEGSIIEIKNEKGGRPKYQCLHCKITFFNEDHVDKGGHRGHVEHCEDVKACFEATVGKRGLGLDFKKVDCHKSEDVKPIPVKTDPDEKKNVLADLPPAHARKLIRFYIEAIDKNVEQGDPISILEVAEKSNTINKIKILKDLFLELGDLCHLPTNPDGSVDLQVKKQIVKNSHIKLDCERVQKINQFGLQSLNIALPKEREERLRWRIPGSWNVKPSELGEKWTPKHDSLLVAGKLEYGQNWNGLIKDKEFGLGQIILNDQGDVKDEVKSRQEYLVNVVNFRGDYNEEDMKAGHKNLWRKNMDQVELKRANKRKFQSDSNQGSGQKKFYGGPSH